MELQEVNEKVSCKIQDLPKAIEKLEEQMLSAARELEFERAGQIRDQLRKLRQLVKK